MTNRHRDCRKESARAGGHLRTTTVVIQLCHNIQHDRLTHSRQRTHSLHWRPHQCALTVRSRLHSRRSPDPLRGLLNAFLHSPSNSRKRWKRKKMSTKISQLVISSHQNIVWFLLLNPSSALPARMPREYIVGSVGNHQWRSSTSPKVVIGRCRCWNRAS